MCIRDRNKIKEALMERGVSSAEFETTETPAVGRKEDVTQTPQMQEISTWFDQREKNGENSAEMKEAVLKQVQLHVCDGKDDSAGSDLDDSSSQWKRHSNGSNGSKRNKRRDQLPSAAPMGDVRLSPLSPRRQKTQGKDSAFNMEDLTPAQRQLAMAQLQGKQDKERQQNANILLF
eukprot:TRINITY_DN2176_c0_g1_i2.p2 TRINITY_DN2176_c0_g1~~TRINITY_DN2176_c0_g1_i2.p2  ORF type:complete len:176 (+),score=55.29 TRINITY_DN2176_c0_g1_i2:140-667(+)